MTPGVAVSEAALRPLRFPRWLGGRAIAPTTVFASLFFLVVSCRTILVSVIPITALEHLGSAQAVSVMFLVVSTAGVVTGLLLPGLILRLRTRRVFYLAAAVSCAGSLAMGLPSLAGFLLGMVGWVVSTVAFEISLNLYIMHLVLRRDIVLFEPKRVLFMVTSFTIGPWLGVALQKHLFHWAPFLLTALVALLTVAYFRFLGLREAGARGRIGDAPRLLGSLRRYVAQPRLRLAWAISFARSAWWGTFMFYAPIYVVTNGLGETLAGIVVSAGVAMVYSVGLWGRFMRRHGMRSMMMLGFGASGVTSIVAALLAGTPWMGVGALLLSGLVIASLDAAGNTAFLRAVRPLEREAMTGVFSTYRDASQLLPPAVFSIALAVLPVQSVFAIMGALMIAMARLCRHMSKRL